jgi:hypothetical protein
MIFTDPYLPSLYLVPWRTTLVHPNLDPSLQDHKPKID